jgi:hypothetical protein
MHDDLGSTREGKTLVENAYLVQAAPVSTRRSKFFPGSRAAERIRRPVSSMNEGFPGLQKSAEKEKKTGRPAPMRRPRREETKQKYRAPMDPQAAAAKGLSESDWELVRAVLLRARSGHPPCRLCRARQDFDGHRGLFCPQRRCIHCNKRYSSVVDKTTQRKHGPPNHCRVQVRALPSPSLVADLLFPPKVREEPRETSTGRNHRLQQSQACMTPSDIKTHPHTTPHAASIPPHAKQRRKGQK